jgi:hypothetical protein
MSKSMIALIAALAAMSIASPAFAQTPDHIGSVLPNHYDQVEQVWGSWTHDPAGDRQRGRDLPPAE